MNPLINSSNLKKGFTGYDIHFLIAEDKYLDSQTELRIQILLFVIYTHVKQLE